MAKKQALIVEDNQSIGEMYIVTLGMIDIEAEHIADGKLALQRLEVATPDLIILDMNLPQVSGHYLYKKIRSTPRLNTTPVIISTANTLVAQTLAGDLGEYDRLLVKPISPSMLQQVIQGLMAKDTGSK